MENVRAACAAAALAVLLLAGAGRAAAASPAAVEPGGLTSIEDTGYVPLASIEARAAGLFKGHPLPTMRYGVDTYRLTFVSRDFDGSLAPITALFFVPRRAEAAEAPVLVFGSGTTGIGDACAPSLEQEEGRHFGDYRDNMLAYAGLGIIVIFPDYLGFNDPSRPQRYFSRLAEGHVMLDAARAVFRFYEAARNLARPMRKVFVAGYSQGGHAAFSAADLWQDYAPEVPLAGAIGFGATTDVQALLREGPAYGPLIFYTYSVMYGLDQVDPNECLQERFARTLERDATSMCIDQFQTYYSYDGTHVYSRAFLEALRGRRVWQAYPSLFRRFLENEAGLSGHGLPALIVQGATDFIVTSATQSLFVAALRERGSRVTYVDLPGISHKEVRQAGFRMSVDWIELVAAGDAGPGLGAVPVD